MQSGLRLTDAERAELQAGLVRAFGPSIRDGHRGGEVPLEAAAGLPRELPLYRLVVIVWRGETSTYAHLANGLSDPFRGAGTRPSVEIIWDRRQAELRRRARPVAVDRRRGDRRQPAPETWTTWGFVVATARR